MSGDVKTDPADVRASADGRAVSPLGRLGVVAGGLGLAASAALSSGDAKQFYFSWLVAYLFFLSIALGSLFFVLCLFVCRAGWGVAIRRVIENVMATMPLFAVLFIPIWLGRHQLYVWTDPAVVAGNALLLGKRAYLNEPFFLLRSLLYLASWSALAVYFSGRSERQDESGDERITRRLQAVAAPGIVVFSLTVTFAAFDWIMSLEPEWYSTIFGVYYFAGSLLASFAFLVVALIFIQARGQLQGVVTLEHLHDVGKLLFAFIVFWAYIGFSQYFLIWYGNMPEETIYFLRRSQGSWPSVAKWLVYGHFLVPFFFFMPRAAKRNRATLVAGSLWLLAMQFLDIYWCVMPVLHPDGARFAIVDATAMLAVGGFFLANFGWVSSRRALVPVRDPRLAESLHFENV